MAFEAFKKAAAAAKESVSELGLEAIAESGLETLKETLHEVNLFRPALKEAGYDLNRAEVELAVSPKLTVHFKILSEVHDDKLNALVRGNPDKKVLGLLVTTLLQSGKLHDAPHPGTLNVDEVKIVLSASPSAVIQFK